MSKFQVIENIEVPASTVTATRKRSDFTEAVDALAVGAGFLFEDKRDLKKLYPTVAPKKFPVEGGGAKKFKIWAVPGTPGTYGVKRLADSTPAEAAAEAAAAPATDGQTAAQVDAFPAE